MTSHDIPLTVHDILLLKLLSIIVFLTLIGIYLYNQQLNEKIKS
jgi:hypothetical protein